MQKKQINFRHKYNKCKKSKQTSNTGKVNIKKANKF